MSDFLDSLDLPVETTAFDEMMTLVSRVDELNRRIEKGEALLKELKEAREKLTLGDLPELMLKNRVDFIGLENGRTLEINERVFISLPADEEKRKVVLQFLIDKDAEHLVKSKIVVENAPDSLKEVLQEKAIPFEAKKDVNTNSFVAWTKAVLGMKKGQIARLSIADFPKEANLYIRREAVIK